MIKKALINALIISTLYQPISYAENLVGYGGVYTPESKSSDSFKNFYRNQEKISSNFRQILEKLSNENKLPFKIIFETDSEELKKLINDSYSLAILITRDDINNEKFEIKESNILINKTFVNVGMAAILYQTVDDITDSKKRNVIIFSLPIVGYSISLKGNKDLSQEELDNTFVKVATKTLEEEIIKKLSLISLSSIEGKVKEIKSKDNIIVDIGSSNGLIKGQFVNISLNDKSLLKGKVTSLDLNSAQITLTNLKDEKISTGFIVKATNIKGLSDETYQIVDFKISSAKAKKWFDEKEIASQASQWFSDFLSERGGKAVLPSKVGSNWVETSNEQSFSVFIKDGQEHIFEMGKPKYQVSLNLTGLSDKKIEESSNSINENWIFKLWLQVDIKEKNFSKEFSLSSVKTILPQTQTFEEKNELFDLLHQLTSKSAKEIE